ncbi:F0F1 ATP synthase subunit A [Futiania mangrovi]|uniref:ATP synthase subunit a n=1 Tax=Futiania mangrovi TaxID=2959716 RepID=A0A9J6P951_9PROT|nr:F0F1 ATP synthase subunit A [Futiania mangrovii]MCP1335301.1 F0F1 ATP synthase subunit A [Futiania mangrovii]
MNISTDQWVIWQGWGLTLNATIAFTWAVMALLAVGARAITLRLDDSETISPWQNMLEVIVTAIRGQIADVGADRPDTYLPFVGTLFLFIAAANLLAIVPGYAPPTASLSTTAALALCVLIAVPVYGIRRRGLARYLLGYARPTLLMLPFNILGEISRTIALAIRLYGNVMSGTVIAGVLIGIAPFFFPVVMQLLGLITGFVQAYIFAILAMVYIASATRAHVGAGDENGRTPPSSPEPMENEPWTPST